MRYAAVVIGVSSGGVEALKLLLPALPASFPLPVAIVHHRDPHSDGFLAAFLNTMSGIAVSEAEDKEPFCAGHAYLAPPGYHLLIESDRSLSLSVDQRVNHCCPSIDVLFESAADVFAESLIGIVLTGANADGAQGLKAIKARGGLAVVQDPQTASATTMPRAALEATAVDHVLDLGRIAPLLTRMCTLEEAYGAAG
ncbi:MAG TPA: chemotaxis protein CheB [Acidobacteriaceae bacterium]|jgi:two-component system chemotaxis response regulator CheB|nr:chemotaxis protein CheB [Acidobacteriaceae bacterium]